MLFISSVMYIVKVFLLSGNIAVMKFELEAHKENFISYLYYCQKHLIIFIEARLKMSVKYKREITKVYLRD